MSDEAALLAAIAAEPDAIEPRLIYADWLQARSDPRGELIVVQAARLAKPDDVHLETRETELTAELTTRLLGDTGLPASLIVRWHFGFVDALRLAPRVIRLLRTAHRAWIAQPAFAVVRELDIDSKYARSLRFIRHLGLTKTVTRLRFGDREPLEGPVLEAIVRCVPRLSALTLRTSRVPPLAVMRGLRELTLELHDLDDEGLRRIVEVPWMLDTFGLTTTSEFAEDRVPLLTQLYDGTTLASVKHFAVGGSLPALDVLETLATSKRTRTLESFTADYYRMASDQLPRIERHREALAKLQLRPVVGQGPYYDVENYSKLGSVLNYRLERPAEALHYYEQALRVRPADSNLRHNLAVALRKLKRLDESLIAFDTIIRDAKTPTASMFNGRHHTLCELGRREEARADLERALAIDPNFAEAWNNLGVERKYMGDVDGAFAAFRRCLELDEQHGYAARNEADLLLELGRAADALVTYQRLLARKPRDPTLLAMIAHAQVELGDAAGARAIVDGCFADPAQERHPRLQVLRALALRDLGEIAAAHADLDACARTTDCPAWFAITVYVKSLDEPALWTHMIPASAIAPRELADAVIAYATAARPSDATAFHEATVDDQIDCAELAVAAALLARDRDLAAERAFAAAALYAAQGPRYFRHWWPLLATVIAVTSRELEAESRALISLVLRATHGRARIADVMTLVV